MKWILTTCLLARYFSDHMLEADYADGEWQTVSIKPYQPISFEPSLMALHYGQSIFEGIKAYRNKNGEAFIFRPYDNLRRFNISADRMDMPAIPEDIFIEGMRQLMPSIRNGFRPRMNIPCISVRLCLQRMPHWV